MPLKAIVSCPISSVEVTGSLSCFRLPSAIFWDISIARPSGRVIDRVRRKPTDTGRRWPRPMR